MAFYPKRGEHLYGPLSFTKNGNLILVANAGTLNTPTGLITSSTSTLAAATSESLTIACNFIRSANAQVYAMIQNPGTGGTIIVTSVVPTQGQFIINVRNLSATLAMTSIYVVQFIILNEG